MDEIDCCGILQCHKEPDDVIKLYDGKNPMKILIDKKCAIYKYINNPIDTKFIQTQCTKYQIDSICFIMLSDCGKFFSNSNLKLSKLLLKVIRITVCLEDDMEIYFNPHFFSPLTYKKINFYDKKINFYHKKINFYEKEIRIHEINIDSFDFLSGCEKILKVYIFLNNIKFVLPNNLNSPFYRLKKLKISCNNYKLSNLSNLLKSHLVELELDNINCSEILQFIPSTLKKLKLIKYTYPNKLTKLSNSEIETLEIIETPGIDYPIGEIIPPSLKTLILKQLWDFNQPLNLTDTNLDTVELIGMLRFNQPLNLLPESLKKLLIIGCISNQYVQTVIPGGLEFLCLDGCSFDKAKIKFLPSGLDTLKLMNCRGFKNIMNTIPENLKFLHIDMDLKSDFWNVKKIKNHDEIIRTDREIIFKNLPANLKSLCMSGDFFSDKKNNTLKLNELMGWLPETLSKIELSGSFDYPVHNLPSSLETLILGDSFNQPIYNLPSSLKTMFLGNSFDQPIDNLPSSLETLILSKSFNQPIDNLPSSLETLVLSQSFNQPIDNLPRNLIELTIIKDSVFNQPIRYLPNNLKILRILAWEFNQPIDGVLPHKLRELELGESFSHPVGLLSKVKKIKINNKLIFK